jgi:hypothetical protein
LLISTGSTFLVSRSIAHWILGGNIRLLGPRARSIKVLDF